MTTVGEFLKLVESMRNAQKAYFRKRDTASLIESKKLEKDVDTILEGFHAKQEAKKAQAESAEG